MQKDIVEIKQKNNFKIFANYIRVLITYLFPWYNVSYCSETRSIKLKYIRFGIKTNKIIKKDKKQLDVKHLPV